MRRTDRHIRKAHSYRRRLLRSLLSAVLPGTGQMVGGFTRRGLVMLALALLLLAIVLVMRLTRWDLMLSWAVRPSVILGLLAFNVVLLGFRLFAVADAYRAGGSQARWSDRAGRYPFGTEYYRTLDRAEQPEQASPPVAASPVAPAPVAASSVAAPHVAAAPVPRRSARPSRAPRWLAGMALGLLLLLTSAPHGVAAYYAYLSHGFLTSVFAGQQAPAPAPTTLLAATSTNTLPPTTTTSEATSTSAATSTTEPATTTTEPLFEWGQGDRLTVLLVGTDAGYGRTGARADSIMVATVDLEDGYVALFGIPRNTGDVPLGDRAAEALGRSTSRDMIGNLYEEAQNYPELAPPGGDPGAVVLSETAALLLGMPVHHYAVVDMGGFVDLVDAFGGIKLNVKERVRVRLSPPRAGESFRVYDIRPGIQELDGHEALAFARSRTGNSDYDRMRRQRCVIMALLYQNGVTDLAFNFPRVIGVLKESLATDIPIDRLADLIRVRGKIKADEMLSLGIGPPGYVRGRNELGYNILKDDVVQTAVREYLEEPEKILESQAASSETSDSDCWKVD